MDELEFKRLIEKYQRGLLTREDKAYMDRWFESIGDHPEDDAWTDDRERLLGARILSKLRSDEISRHVDDKNRAQRRRYLHYGYRIAASFLILVLAYVGWQFYVAERNVPTKELVAAATGGVKKVVLPDNSIVWLKGNSHLTYPAAFEGDTRRVALSGEALFEVSKDPSHPFIIECGDLLTTVLGTSFNIRTLDKDIEVLVLTGKVALTSKTDKEGIIVLPNEKALYSVTKKQIAKVGAAIPESETVAAVVEGTDYNMNFENTRMEEVIRRIEGKFNVDIVAEDETLRNCVITANFTDESLDRTLDMISQALNIDYETASDEVRLTGTGCP